MEKESEKVGKGKEEGKLVKKTTLKKPSKFSVVAMQRIGIIDLHVLCQVFSAVRKEGRGVKKER